MAVSNVPQVKLGAEAPNSKVVKVPDVQRSSGTGGSNETNVTKGTRGSSAINGTRGTTAPPADVDHCSLLDFESSDRPLVVNFGSAT